MSDRTAYLRHCLFISLRKRLPAIGFLTAAALVALFVLGAGLLAPLAAAVLALLGAGWVLLTSYYRHRDDIELRHLTGLSFPGSGQ